MNVDPAGNPSAEPGMNAPGTVAHKASYTSRMSRIMSIVRLPATAPHKLSAPATFPTLPSSIAAALTSPPSEPPVIITLSGVPKWLTNTS